MNPDTTDLNTVNPELRKLLSEGISATIHDWKQVQDSLAALGGGDATLVETYEHALLICRAIANVGMFWIMLSDTAKNEMAERFSKSQS